MIALLSLGSAREYVHPEPFPVAEFKERRGRAFAELRGDILIVPASPSPARIDSQGFQEDPNFFYLTGLRDELASLLLLDGAARRSWLFRPTKLAGFTGRFVSPNRSSIALLTERLGLDHVADSDDFIPYLRRRVEESPSVVIRLAPATADELISASPAWPTGLERDAGWRARLAADIAKALPSAKIVQDTALLIQLRQRKTPAEIDALGRAGAASARGVLAALRAIAPGQQQRSVEVATLAVCLKEADGVSFWPWAMSGPLAVYPSPWRSLADARHLDRTMQAGELVRVDVGCAMNGYMGDVGRTVPVSGRFSDGQRETWNLLVSAYRAGLAKIRDGVRQGDVISASFSEIRRLQGQLRTDLARSAAAVILTPNGAPDWQIHGIGTEAAEPLPDVLRAGMVLDYEPIFSVDGQGFYLEDMIVVTTTGYQLLTPGLPYRSDEVERAMRGRKW